MTRSLIPNSTQVPDIILDEWMPHLSGAELAVVLAVARKTFGWGKSFDRIGTMQMMECTGLKRRAVQIACDSLEATGILAIRVAGDGVTSNAYKLNMDAPDSVLAALIARSNEAETKHAEALGKPAETDGGGAENAPGAENALVQKKTTGGAKNAPEGAHKMRPSRDTLRNTIQETEEPCLKKDMVTTQDANKRQSFTAPTLEEVRAYFAEQSRPDLADEWFGYWDSVNWWRKRGVRMQKWHSAAAGWVSQKKSDESRTPPHRASAAANRPSTLQGMIDDTARAVRAEEARLTDLRQAAQRKGLPQ